MPNYSELENVTLTEARQLKEGEGKKGHWELWVVQINDPDWNEIEFSYFVGDKNGPPPDKGTTIKKFRFVEDDQAQSGYRCTSMVYEDASKPKPKPKPAPKGQPQNTGGNGDKGKNDPWWFCLSYAKDLVCAHPKLGELSIKEAAQAVLAVARAFEAGQVKQSPSEQPKQDDGLTEYMNKAKELKTKLNEATGGDGAYFNCLHNFGFKVASDASDEPSRKDVLDQLEKALEVAVTEPDDDSIPF